MLRTSTGQPLLYIYDGQGSPVALISSFSTTAFQYSFDPYGVATLDQTSGGNATGQTPFLYTGGLHDRTTGFIKQGARYYDPTEGRWTQHDTLDAPLDPANANRYAYAANNPVNYIDPTGQVIDPFGALGRAFSVGDALAIAQAAAAGDWESVAALSYGVAIGTVVGVGCEALLVAAAPVTATASLAGSAGCLAAGTACRYCWNQLCVQHAVGRKAMPEFVALLLPFAVIAGVVAVAAVLIATQKRPTNQRHKPAPLQSEISKRMMLFYIYVGAAALVVFVVSYVVSQS